MAEDASATLLLAAAADLAAVLDADRLVLIILGRPLAVRGTVGVPG